jgi:hypothetical protein
VGSGDCVVVVVVARSQVSGTARAQKLKANEDQAVSNLESTLKESRKFLLFAVGLRH